MRFVILYPITHPHGSCIATGDGLARIAKVAESLGFDGLAFTEHPAPTSDWMDYRQHDTFDLFAALGFCAGATTRIAVTTYLLVLPYHSPFVAAKALATLDVLSNGRLRIVAGAGYLRPEFDALNVDFEERNGIFEESIEVIRGLWSQSPFSFAGTHFSCSSVVSHPQPRSASGPPIIIGGNSKLARARAARNDGWSPVLSTPELAGFDADATRTPALVSIDVLARQIEEVRASARELQRKDDLFIQAQTPDSAFPISGGSVEQHRDHLGRLGEAGVDALVVKIPGRDVETAIEALSEYSANFRLSGHDRR